MRGRRPALPTLLERRATDEFSPPPYTRAERRAVRRVLEGSPGSARDVGLPLAAYLAGRLGTAASLLALNEAWDERFYRVPEEATRDVAAADAALGGSELVIDVQTHFVADRPECAIWRRDLPALYRSVAPEGWKGIDELAGYDLAEYLRCVFLESETAVAVLTSGPGLGPDRMLFNHELAGTREFLEGLGATGRLLNHCVVHPEVPGEIDAMAAIAERHAPAGWKLYTLGQSGADGRRTPGWWLDDERVGVPFLERARELGVRRVCVHKGISQLAATGSPRDVGPAARAFPELDFLIYHSGYEMPRGEPPEEGPYAEETADVGVNRLIRSLRESGIRPGSNVYAELGSTWFSLVRRPREAAHVLGKLLLAVGPDRVLWGTDSIWYGPSQGVVDAFRAFQIPLEYQERYGYPTLTPEIKARILGLNAARVYGLDVAAVRERVSRDDLAWARTALAEYRREGLRGVTRGSGPRSRRC